jgi:hypothetical protein
MLFRQNVRLAIISSVLSCFCCVARAQYSTVSCSHGETGTCRQASSCSQSDIQAAINASSSGGKGYASPTSFDGDGVYVPGGSCSWSSPVSWTNKNINLIGSNPTISHSSNAFAVGVSNSGPTAAAFRISGFTFTGSTGGNLLNLNSGGQGGAVSNIGTAWAGFFRVDHLTYKYSSSGNVFILYGPVFGLFDHLNGSTNNNHFEQANLLDSEYDAMHAGNYSLMEGEYVGRILSAGPDSSSPGGLGSKYMDFIEDSTFNCSGNYSGAISDSESGGQRMVFRHNSLTGTCFHYAHWTRGSEWDGDLYEIYNNTYNGGANGQFPMRFGAGTGVIFNNTITSYSDPTVHVDETRGAGGESSNGPFYDCNGSRAVDGNAGDGNAPGWPCAGQVGTACIGGNCSRGSMNSVPLLVWNNGSQSGCSTGGSCTNSVTVNVDGPMGSGNSVARNMANYIKSTPHNVSGPLNGAVDYCQGASEPSSCGIYKNTYSPYTYPHPLTAGGTTAAVPPPPTNLQGVAQ